MTRTTSIIRSCTRAVCALILLACAVALAGCGSLIVPVPVDEQGEPKIERTEALVLNPEVEDKADVVLDVWCRNLTNIRRITLRFIHVVDPEWQSVCTTRSEE